MKIKTLLFAAALMVCASASAQFTTSSSRSSSSSQLERGWNSVYVQYNAQKFRGTDDSDFLKSMNGVTVGYNRGIGLSSSIPLYLEIGGGVQYSAKSKDDVDFHLLSAIVPVSVIYHFNIPNSIVAIEPLAGLNFRYNIWGEIKDKSGDDDGYRYSYDETEDNKTNIFSDKDTGDNPAERFQVGVHFGVNVVFNKFVLGVKYNIALSNFWKYKYEPENDYYYHQQDNKTADVKFNTFTISAGYRF